MQLYTKILIGLVLGGVVGGIANWANIQWLVDGLAGIEPLGRAFIDLITMIVIPLVVASLLVGTASLGDLRKLGRIGGKTILYYLSTTAVAVTIGLVLANVLQPGGGVPESTRDELAAQYGTQASERVEVAAEAPGWFETLLGIIPRNPIQAAANMDMLPLIFFTICFGAALTAIDKEKRDAVIGFFDGVNQASMVLINWIMELAPYAVFILIGAVVATFGAALLQSLLVYSLVVVGGLLLHLTITYGLILRTFAGLSPIAFFKRVAAVPLLAFSTSSSNATLPLTIETAEEKVGVSNEVASFVLPLGATINMDGTALYQAVAALFIAQIYGIPLDLGQQLIIVLTATLASVGTAGVPSAGIIMLIIVLNAVDMGPQVAGGIALILGVDRILDMLRTAVNVCGDLTCSAVIARTEGETLNLEPEPVGAD